MILWIESDQYRLTTVTNGAAFTSFISIGTLHQITLEVKNDFPLVSAAVLKDFYVDDFLSAGKNDKKSWN